MDGNSTCSGLNWTNTATDNGQIGSNCTLPFLGLNTSVNASPLPVYKSQGITGTSPELERALRISDTASRWIALCSVILSILGNLLVIFANLKLKTLPVYKKLILHLAICDLVYSTFYILWLHKRFSDHLWIFGDFLCKCTIMWSSALSCAMFTITFIAVERYRTIMNPFLPKLKNKSIVASLVALWILAIGIHIPFAQRKEIRPVYGKMDCSTVWKEDDSFGKQKYYDLVVFAVIYPIPLTLIFYCYGRICCNAMKGFNMGKLQKRTPIASRNIASQRSKRYNKLLVMLALVLIVFLITTTPNQVFIIWMNFAPRQGRTMESLRRDFLILISLAPLVHLHTWLNPIIYCISDAQYRKNLKKLFGSCLTNFNRSTHQFLSSKLLKRQQTTTYSSRASNGSPLIKCRQISLHTDSLRSKHNLAATAEYRRSDALLLPVMFEMQPVSQSNGSPHEYFTALSHRDDEEVNDNSNNNSLKNSADQHSRDSS